MQKMTQAAFLKKMKDARENVNKFAKLPHGAYCCLLQKMLYKPSKKGKEMVTAIYKVLEGNHRGKEHRVFYQIENDIAFNILIQDMENLGYPTEEVNSFDMLLALLEQVTKDQLRVGIRISENPDPEYVNFPRTRIETVIEGEDPIVNVVVGESPVVEYTEPEPEVVEADTSVQQTSKPTVTEAEVVEAEVVEEEVVEEEGSQEVDVGSNVVFTFKGAEKTGIIKECAEDGLSAKISCEGKLYKVKSENILGVA